MIIPSYINDIINKLNDSEYSAFLVGGCVRDSIIGRKTNDYDIATNATPTEMLEIFKNYTTTTCGIKHGTVCVIIDKKFIEITTFRKEIGYDDNRHPDKVIFANTIEEDLARRDFTINALAYNKETGIIDIFDGEKDITKGVIKCVGNPEERFSEDSLRILRCIRFASQLGFSIEEETENAMLKCKDKLKFLSKERILAELEKTLLGDYVVDTLLKHKEILFEIIPKLRDIDGLEQNSPYHIYNVYEHTLRTLPHLPKDGVLRLAMLFHDIGKSVTYSEDEYGVGHFYNHGRKGKIIADDILKSLKVSNKNRLLILELIKYHSDTLTDKKPNIKKWLSIFGKENFEKFLKIRYSDCMAKEEQTSIQNSEELVKIRKVFREIIDNKECYSVKQLDIDGNDIKSLDIVTQEKIGKVLDLLLKAVIKEKVRNNKDSLIAYVKNIGNML